MRLSTTHTFQVTSPIGTRHITINIRATTSDFGEATGIAVVGVTAAGEVEATEEIGDTEVIPAGVTMGAEEEEVEAGAESNKSITKSLFIKTR